jgi:predicted  nucleic acid-binding Zn-ribbon protein
MLIRFEPIIFILIGYYFGRHPSRQNEKALKEEIQNQTSRADAAQYAKEKAQMERETLEEKIKNARTALKTIEPDSAKAVKGILDS